jgi:tetratricopeptide (TPR) repeat protein
MAIEAPSPSPPSSAPVGAIVVLILAALAYVAMAVGLADLNSSDAAGNGITAAFTFLFGIFVWLWLGVLLLIAGIRGNMPFWMGIVLAVLLPASAITAVIALEMQGPDNPWPLIEPFALPPVVALYGLYARLTRLHRAIPLVPVSAAALVAMTVLTLIPLPQFVAHERLRAEARAESAAEEKAAQDAANKRHAEALAKFEKLTPSSPLSDWAAFFGRDNEFDEPAIAAARKLPNRQTEAIDALHRGMIFPLAEYGRLDLQATPEFCAASRDFLIAAAASHKTSAAAPDRSAEDYFDPLLGGVELLTKENCDLDAAVKAIDAAIAPSPKGNPFRAMLAWRQANGFFRRQDYDRAIAGYTAAIELSPDFSQYWADRGDAYLDKLDYAKAIPDYSEAVRLNPGYSTVYNSRGYCYHALGDDDHALADFDKTIELRPEFPRALYNRGNIYAARGDLTRAITDYDAAIAIAPKFWEALASRGRAHYSQGAYAEAAADLSAALPLGSGNTTPYTILWLYLARTRAGQPARDALAQDAATLDKTAWPGPIVSAFLGETTPAEVLAGSQADNDHACEADFYFGAADPSTARDLLQKAVAICPADFTEAPAAKLELEKLPR